MGIRGVFRVALKAGCVVGLMVAAAGAQAATQRALPTPQAASLQPGDPLSVDVDYVTVDPVTSATRGLSLRLHFDSSRLEFQSLSNVLTTSLIVEGDAPQVDSGDFDNDPSTDSFVLLTWNDSTNQWPGGDLPARLFTANFVSTESFVAGSTAIRFSARFTAPDFDFDARVVAVTGVPGPDTQAPTIQLVGGALITIIQGNLFVDPGATAFDGRDGNITNRIVVNGVVNTNVPADYAITYDVTDTAGNAAAQATRTVRVLPPDRTPPVVNVPTNDFTLEATSAAGISGVAFAEFIAAVTATDDRYGDLPVSNDAPTVFPLGDTIVRFSATDLEGNLGSSDVRVSVVDTTPPVFLPIQGIIVEAEGPDGTSSELAAIVAFLASARANDLVDAQVTIQNDAPTLFPLGATVVTFTAFDSFENAATLQSTVTVVDTTDPIISVPEPITVEATSAAGVLVEEEEAIGVFLAAAVASDLVDGDLPVGNDLDQSTIPLGTTSVEFTATDTSGNSVSATSAIQVVDTTAPVVTPPNDITVVERGDGQISRSAAVLAPFFAGVSATDLVDAEVDISDDAPDQLVVGSNLVTFSGVDDNENIGTATANVIVLTAGEGDQDQDLMSDAFEVEFGLDPNDPADADDDPDADGFTNLEEFQNGTDPTIDSAIPVVTAPDDITITAFGPLTPVSLGEGSATDVPDGDLEVRVSGQLSPFPPGRYEVVYEAEDQAGNVGSAIQVVVVSALAELSPSQNVSEGQTVVVSVILNGDAGVYPVSVDFNVAGTADAADHNLVGGTLVIEQGRSGQIVFNTTADGQTEGNETIEISLTNATNAVVGPISTHRVTIVEQNRPPVAEITVSQQLNEGPPLLGTRLLTTGGTVTATALVSDPNANDTAQFNWSASSAALARLNGNTAPTFQFNPANVAPGFYRLSLTVTDSGNASVTSTQLIEIMSGAPALSATADADGDGINDAADGFSDDDNDGIPNFQDATPDTNVLRSIASSSQFLLITEPGLDLSIGQVAFAADASGARIALADIGARGGPEGGAVDPGDVNFNYDLPFFDFTIDGVDVGDSVAIVLPFPNGLPEGTLTYRKFVPGTGFRSFVSDAANSVASAAGSAGICPGPGSNLYSPGLTAGHFCVQLTLQDGGPNDADRSANGRIVDPGSVGRAAPPLPPPPPPAPQSSGGGGGCTVGDGSGDPLLPLLAVGAALYVWRRRPLF